MLYSLDGVHGAAMWLTTWRAHVRWPGDTRSLNLSHGLGFKVPCATIPSTYSASFLFTPSCAMKFTILAPPLALQLALLAFPMLLWLGPPQLWLEPSRLHLLSRLCNNTLPYPRSLRCHGAIGSVAGERGEGASLRGPLCHILST